MHISRLIVAVAVLATSEASAAPCKAPALRQGMPYKSARASVLKAGFQAPRPPSFGYQKDDEKVASDCNGDVKVCNNFPVIESCSGQGLCNMVFTDAYGNKLTVTTEGDGPRRASVSSFDMACKK